MKSVFIASAKHDYHAWRYVTPFQRQLDVVGTIQQADLVMFTGGSDVYPGLYEEPVGKHTRFYLERDHDEMKSFEAAVQLKIPMVGICRGGQFLTAMSGGRLVQDVTGHTTTHMLETSGGEKHFVSSTHHQMFCPFEMQEDDYQLLAWACLSKESGCLSSRYWDGNDQEMQIMHEVKKEPEVVYYPNTKALAIQFHPEYMPADSSGVLYANELVRKLLNGESFK